LSASFLQTHALGRAEEMPGKPFSGEARLRHETAHNPGLATWPQRKGVAVCEDKSTDNAEVDGSIPSSPTDRTDRPSDCPGQGGFGRVGGAECCPATPTTCPRWAYAGACPQPIGTASGASASSPPGQYQARYWHTDARHIAPETFAAKADALAWLARAAADVTRGAWLDPTAGKATFAEVAERWTESNPLKRSSSRLRDQSILTNHVVPVLGCEPMSRVLVKGH
jgi:hypothetical protein